MSLRGRLLCLFMLFVALVCAAGGATLIVNARSAVQAEMRSALSLAEAVARRAGDGDTDALLAELGLRHVRIVADGAARPSPEVPPDGAPALFVALIGVEPMERAVSAAAGGRVTVIAEPWDEIAEVWEDVADLGSLVLLLSALAIGFASWSTGQALRPLASFEQGLERLRDGAFTVTLHQCGVPELARIGMRIEELAAALRHAETENRRLGRQIVAVQDQERGDLAREIHDELGPSLFSIKVDAKRIAQLTEAGTTPAEAAERAHAILAMADTLHRLSRRILTRLRPVVLDHMPLGEALEEMIAAHRGRHPDIGWSLRVHGPLDALVDPQRVTVYRLVQEAATNALRHARPSRVAVTLRHGEAGRDGLGVVEVRVDDDGVGLGDDLDPGFGIAGMRDRVQALGGRLTIAAAPGGGTSVTAAIPVPTERQAAVWAGPGNGAGAEKTRR